MKLASTASTALIMSALLIALSGCEGKEGPAEQAGKGVDQATQKAGEQLENAGESIQDAAQGDEK